MTDDELFGQWWQNEANDSIPQPMTRTQIAKAAFLAALKIGRERRYTEGYNKALDDVFSMNGPSRAITKLRAAIRGKG